MCLAYFTINVINAPARSVPRFESSRVTGVSSMCQDVRRRPCSVPNVPPVPKIVTELAVFRKDCLVFNLCDQCA